jgi:hypothetical protein
MRTSRHSFRLTHRHGRDLWLISSGLIIHSQHDMSAQIGLHHHNIKAPLAQIGPHLYRQRRSPTMPICGLLVVLIQIGHHQHNIKAPLAQITPRRKSLTHVLLIPDSLRPSFRLIPHLGQSSEDCKYQKIFIRYQYGERKFKSAYARCNNKAFNRPCREINNWQWHMYN